MISPRRAFLGAALASALASGGGHDDQEWDRKFRAFVKEINRFLEPWNEGIFDEKQWKRVRAAWLTLDDK
jgi:hypothetical protein